MRGRVPVPRYGAVSPLPDKGTGRAAGAPAPSSPRAGWSWEKLAARRREAARESEERERKKEQNPSWDGLETTSSGADTKFPGQLLLAAGDAASLSHAAGAVTKAPFSRRPPQILPLSPPPFSSQSKTSKHLFQLGLPPCIPPDPLAHRTKASPSRPPCCCLGVQQGGQPPPRVPAAQMLTPRCDPRCHAAPQPPGCLTRVQGVLFQLCACLQRGSAGRAPWQFLGGPRHRGGATGADASAVPSPRWLRAGQGSARNASSTWAA